MSNKQHCIIILYNGIDIPEIAENAIMEQLVQVLVDKRITIPELTTVVYKDSTGIATSLVNDAVSVTAKGKSGQESPVNPIDNALVYLKHRYSEELKDSNHTKLIIKMTSDITAHEAAVEKGQGGDPLLINALEILNKTGYLYSEVAHHGISKRALDTMELVYTSVYTKA